MPANHPACPPRPRPFQLPLPLLSLLLILATTVLALEIPLEVRERHGFARRGELVTSGVPLPRDFGNDLSRLGVLSPAGTAVPSQFETLATWPDGAPRWVLVHFLADCAPHGAARYLLTDRGTASATPLPLSVAEDSTGVTIATGVLRCRLSREYFDLFEEVYLDHNRDGAFSAEEKISTPESGPGIFALDAEGRRLASRWGKVTSFTVEEDGPLRATVAVRGALYEEEYYRRGEPLVDYTARLHFQAGSGLVRVFFTLENHDRRPSRSRMGATAALGAGPPGGSFFEDFSLATRLAFDGPIQLSVGDGPRELLDRVVLTARGGIYQESSGGEHWFHRNHMNRDRKIPLTFRGAKIFLDGGGAATAGTVPRPGCTPATAGSGWRWLSATSGRISPRRFRPIRTAQLRVALWPDEFPDAARAAGGRDQDPRAGVLLPHRAPGQHPR